MQHTQHQGHPGICISRQLWEGNALNLMASGKQTTSVATWILELHQLMLELSSGRRAKQGALLLMLVL